MYEDCETVVRCALSVTEVEAGLHQGSVPRLVSQTKVVENCVETRDVV